MKKILWFIFALVFPIVFCFWFIVRVFYMMTKDLITYIKQQWAEFLNERNNT